MQQGFVVMALGMATVFGFLIVMVTAMRLSASFFKRFAHRFAADPPAADPEGGDEMTALAIAVAHARWRP